MSTLLQLGENHRAIENEIERIATETEGEITPELSALLDRALDEEFKQGKKLDGYGYLIDRQEKEVEILTMRKKAIEMRINRHKRSLDSAKDRLHAFMRMTEVGEIGGDYYTFKRVLSGKAPVILREGVTAESLPPEFRREKHTIEVDKNALSDALKALKEGEQSVFAYFGEKKETVRRK